MDRVGAPPLDPAADTVFGHEFCAEVVEHGPDTTGTLPVGTRVCSVPILFGPSGVEQIGYSNSLSRSPGRAAWCSRSCWSSRCPTPSTPTWPP